MNIVSRQHLKYIFVLLFVMVAYLVFVIIKPFLNAILSAIILSYVCYPIFKYLKKRTKKEKTSAAIVTILILFIITLPLAFMLNTIAHEAISSYSNLKQNLDANTFFGVNCEEEKALVCDISEFLGISNSNFSFYLGEIFKRTANWLISATSSFILTLPARILDVVVMFFTLFYLLMNGKNLISKFWLLIPLKKNHQKDIMQQFNDIIYAVVFGYFITAIAQGSVGALGFVIFGVSSPIFWGFMMALASIFPVFGTALIWLPASLSLFLSGLFASDMLLVGKGIGLFLYGTFLISLLDNFIKPGFISYRTKISPAIILIGVLGGIYTFGLIGVVIGPLILAIFSTFVDIYEKDRK